MILFIAYILILFNIAEGHPKEVSIKELNIVLFFAENDASPKSQEGLKVLNMPEIARIKLNAPITNTKPYSYVFERNVQNCEEILWEGLESLTHFCQNALGMKSATVMVSSEQISNEGVNRKDATTKVLEPRQFPRRTHSFPSSLQLDDDLLPILSSNKKPKVQKFDLITSPKHTEVFKIRVKRSEPEIVEKPPEIPDVPLGKDRNKPGWDVLDVMSHVRFSFFGKLFNDDIKGPNDDALNKMRNVIGQTKPDPGLFESVKSTLSSLMDESNSQPFLLMVFGGRLSTIHDCHSPLVQSIKHVMENTDPAKTLLVLSPGCPADENAMNILQQKNIVNIVEGGSGKRSRNTSLSEASPVFAKGPKSEKLRTLTQIYDIPLTIKSIMEEISPNFGENHQDQQYLHNSDSSEVLRRVKRSSSNRNACNSVLVSASAFVILIHFKLCVL